MPKKKVKIEVGSGLSNLLTNILEATQQINEGVSKIKDVVGGFEGLSKKLLPTIEIDPSNKVTPVTIKVKHADDHSPLQPSSDESEAQPTARGNAKRRSRTGR